MTDQATFREPDVFERKCMSRDILHGLTTRWSVLAIAALAEGDFRFNALRRRVDGVSERMLSQTLQGLERDGFVSRTVLQTIPPRVEYSLTDLGHRLAGPVLNLVETVHGSVDEVVAARARYDADRSGDRQSVDGVPASD
ncbi:transcriptional regulator [Mycolicibacterium obuense]|uniref:Transcriptional regulator n=1 Tax=Mycolicibacterium obuense TaxID=1807 RepID=A0A4R5X7D3_9MYCO|nr:helix-turn-helix domain-containing protein [Mycolicibacterium obuense]TDL07505.1 transcriptional regulator [Mycolicibacterium obuense]